MEVRPEEPHALPLFTIMRGKIQVGYQQTALTRNLHFESLMQARKGQNFIYSSDYLL